MIVREMKKKDHASFKKLFEEAYTEYSESLRLSNPKQYEKERQEKRQVTHARFNFYLKTGSSYVAEKEGKVIGYVASQTASYMHGVDKLLWIEHIVVKSEFRRRGTGTALLQRLPDHARHNDADRVYSTINPDNKASIRLHEKIGFNVRNWKIASLRTANHFLATF